VASKAKVLWIGEVVYAIDIAKRYNYPILDWVWCSTFATRREGLEWIKGIYPRMHGKKQMWIKKRIVRYERGE
jgi:hypothetical protein